MDEQKTEKELNFERQKQILERSGFGKKYKWGKQNHAIFNKKHPLPPNK